MKGRVKFWSIRRGWGFIIDSDGNKYFAHYSDLKTGNQYRLLITDQEVEFNAVETPKGPKALDVRPTDCKNVEVGCGNHGNVR
jgi:CspA family cold shock protein